ncbi:hypothetical protein UY3_08467 [Chelonia mydas]|uniref:Uncharacterized protein n=1 Tax=Chelonia mydas TaxID=8469 RepID=M7BB20_CHEMY|nr:hypothetical protein UY3_08467 [Chelonia mydas]
MLSSATKKSYRVIGKTALYRTCFDPPERSAPPPPPIADLPYYIRIRIVLRSRCNSVVPVCEKRIRTTKKGRRWKCSHSTPDQFSVKDSGKGDSEFNDSDSDISGEGLKKPSSQTAEKQVGTTACTDGRTYKDTERYCRFYVQQSQTSKTIPLHYENDYMIAYSTTPIYQPILQLGKPNFLPQQPKQAERVLSS